MTRPVAPHSIRPVVNLGSLELGGNRFQPAGELMERFRQLLLDDAARRLLVALQPAELGSRLVQLVGDQEAGHQQQPSLARRPGALDQLAHAAIEAAGELAQMLLLPGIAFVLTLSPLGSSLFEGATLRSALRAGGITAFSTLGFVALSFSLVWQHRLRAATAAKL